jgi:hypothetical protein
VFREEIELDEAEHSPAAGVPGVPSGGAAGARTDENENESTGEIPAIR